VSLLTQRPFCSGQHRKDIEDQLEIDDNIFTKDFSGPRLGDVNVLVQRSKDRTATRDLNVSLLKEEFERDFWPFLAAKY
jgi:accessory colonization factor AcfC